MIRRLLVFLFFCSLHFSLPASTPELLTDFSAQSLLPPVSKSLSNSPQETGPRSRSNSKKNLHISIGSVEVRNLDLVSREIFVSEQIKDNHLEMIFFTARHGNEEDFKFHFEALAQKRAPAEMVRDFSFGPHGHALLLDAIHGNNPRIFDAVLEFDGLRVDKLIELDSDESDTDESAVDDDEFSCETGLKHFTNRPRRHSHDDEDEDSIPLCESIRRHAEHKSDPLPRRYTLGTKLLRIAIHQSATSIVEHLIKVYGLRDEISDGFQTALHFAVEGKHENLISLLLEEAGSRINSIDHHHMTPLLLACKLGHDRVATKLIAFGADLSVQDDRHRNSVFYAARAGSVGLLRLMAARAEERGVDFKRLALTPESGSLNTALHVCPDYATFAFFAAEMQMNMNEPLNVNSMTPEQLFEHLSRK